MANPEALNGDAPAYGVKGWKRKCEPFSGVFVGVRRVTIKRWWSRDRERPFPEWRSP